MSSNWIEMLINCTGLFIDGVWQSPSNRENFLVEDPATNKKVGLVVNGTTQDALLAGEAANTSLPEWREHSALERAEILERICSLLLKYIDEFSETIVYEEGKPMSEARGEVLASADFFRWYSEEARRTQNEILTTDKNGKTPIILHEPYGVVLAVTPWNDPLGMIARKIAPALAAGCTVVLKPASLTPLSALLLAEIMKFAGVPNGVFNIFTTKDSNNCVSALINQGYVRKLTFTGSTLIGQDLARKASEQMIDMTMELGGNAPFIVMEDANLEQAAKGVLLRKFRNAGQGCTCVNRLYIHESVAAHFIEEIAERISNFKLGHGINPETNIGPLIRQQEVSRLDKLVDNAKKEGAIVVNSGATPSNDLAVGNFFPPMLLTNVKDDMEITNEEIFGPILPAITFISEEEVINRANNTDYGLAAYVFTEDDKKALRMASKLEAGIIGINDESPQTARCPVGGIKMSGMGVEGGRDGLYEFLVHKYISIKS